MLLEPSHIQDLLGSFQGRFNANRRMKASAVMMILFNSASSPAGSRTRMLFIEKVRDNSRHAGQIAFPGGRIEAFDASPLAAALRETKEEIDIDIEQLIWLGTMGFFRTITSGYDVAVHVGWTAPPLRLAPRRQEVAAIYEIPLADLYAQFNPQLRLQRRTDLMNLHFHWIVPDSRRQICIWGLTARVLHAFFKCFALSQHP